MPNIYDRVMVFLFFLILFFNHLMGSSPSIEFELDKNQWELAYEVGIDDFKIVEYIPKGESLHNWTEHIAIVDYEEVSDTPRNVYQSIIENLSDVKERIIEEDQESLIAEWNLERVDAPAEHSWVKIFAKDNTIHTLMVTSRNTEKVQEQGKVWEGILKKSRLTQ